SMFSSLYCGVTDIAVLYMKERTLHSLKLSGTPCIAEGFRKHNKPRENSRGLIQILRLNDIEVRGEILTEGK
ncbi:MAG: hypothetical protein IJQ56_08485, partial [Synergistaceae bacterium]|nr:hypothetical protein [Synergistaceae bacterium]